MERDNNPSRGDDGARAEAEMKEREAHAFTGNGPGVIGADNCQICGKWYDEHPAPQGDDTLVARLGQKRMRVHDLSGVGWEVDPDCAAAAALIRSQAAEIAGLRLGLTDWQTDAANLAGAASAAESLLAEAGEALDLARKTMRNSRGAIESDQVDDKDVCRQLSRGIEAIDAALSRLKPGEKGGGE